MAIKDSQKYTSDRLQKLRDYLQTYIDIGEPIDYEILVDGLKVVKRTKNTAMFDLYQNFVDGDSRGMEVLLYNGTSNHHDKFVYFFKEDPTIVVAPLPSMNGLGEVEVDERISKALVTEKRNWEFELMKVENARLQEEVSDLEIEVEELQEAIALFNAENTAAKDAAPMKNMLGIVGSTLVENLLKNPKIVSAVPGLAGLLDDPTQEKEEEHADAQVSFTSETPETTSPAPAKTISAEDQKAIDYIEQLKSVLKQEEFHTVMHIVGIMVNDIPKINDVLNFLTTKSDEQGNNE